MKTIFRVKTSGGQVVAEFSTWWATRDFCEDYGFVHDIEQICSGKDTVFIDKHHVHANH